jgi:hypothetical protein
MSFHECEDTIECSIYGVPRPCCDAGADRYLRPGKKIRGLQFQMDGMAGIFICYRREDGAPYAGRLYDWIVARFGKERIFMDTDTIPLGVDFVDSIEQRVGSCDVLIAIIGRNWLTCIDENGSRRIDSPDDFVLLEIASALSRNIRVIPVLVEGARMPRPQDLPSPISKLARRQAPEVSDTRFRYNTFFDQLKRHWMRRSKRETPTSGALKPSGLSANVKNRSRPRLSGSLSRNSGSKLGISSEARHSPSSRRESVRQDVRDP